jgi:hypothetical protein
MMQGAMQPSCSITVSCLTRAGFHAKLFAVKRYSVWQVGRKVGSGTGVDQPQGRPTSHPEWVGERWPFLVPGDQRLTVRRDEQPPAKGQTSRGVDQHRTARGYRLLTFLLAIAQDAGLVGRAEGKLLAQEQTGRKAGQHLAPKAW